MSARARAALALVLAAPSCRGGDAEAQGAALRALFRGREHARALVVWGDAREAGPVFAALGVRGQAVDPAGAARLAAASGLPVARATAADMERLFAEHPDGWAAFFARHPGAAGLVEVGPLERTGDSAWVTVGRSCGEQCLSAWRVTLVRGGVWRTVDVRTVRVPRGR